MSTLFVDKVKKPEDIHLTDIGTVPKHCQWDDVVCPKDMSPPPSEPLRLPTMETEQQNNVSWALTLQHAQLLDWEGIMSLFQRQNSKDLSRMLLGPLEVSAEKGSHHHCLIKLTQAKSRGWLIKRIPQLATAAWFRPVKSMGNFSLKESIYKYEQYCTKQGAPLLDIGRPSEPLKTKAASTSKTDRVRELVKAGHNYRQIMDMDGMAGMSRVIKENMRFYPPRSELTHVILVSGGTGVGKTTTIKKALKAFQERNPTFDLSVHFKPGSWGKFHDGYDQHKIQWIEDPGPLQTSKYDQTYMSWLAVMGNDVEVTVEIKGSAVPYVAKLLIITTNLEPNDMLVGIASYHQEALYNRLTKRWFKMTGIKQRHWLYSWFLKQITEVFGEEYANPEIEPDVGFNKYPLYMSESEAESLDMNWPYVGYDNFSPDPDRASTPIPPSGSSTVLEACPDVDDTIVVSDSEELSPPPKKKRRITNAFGERVRSIPQWCKDAVDSKPRGKRVLWDSDTEEDLEITRSLGDLTRDSDISDADSVNKDNTFTSYEHSTFEASFIDDFVKHDSSVGSTGSSIYSSGSEYDVSDDAGW